MMRSHYCLSSVTRISGLASRDFTVIPIDRRRWGNGDYVCGEVLNSSRVPMELATGRMTEVYRGDLVIGALGRRFATLEAVGRWEDVGDDGRLHSLTGAGLFGRLTSVSTLLPNLVRMNYRGHVHVDGEPLTMGDCARNGPDRPLGCPVVLVVGTSMSAGKTATCRVVIRLLRARGLRVAGAKLTGAGRYRDILTMRDAGASAVFDFVDVGLPSSICDPEEYRLRLRSLLGMIGESEPDVLVAEAGASPLEPYNGGVAIDELGARVQCLILAAGDPYAVIGLEQAFQLRPDLVTGVATSTEAGCELIEKLAGLPALNVLDRDVHSRIDTIVARKLALDGVAVPAAGETGGSAEV